MLVVSMTSAPVGTESGPTARVASRRSRETISLSNSRISTISPRARSWLRAPAGTLLWRGVKVEFELGAGKNHGTLVATFGDDVTALFADGALLGDEHFTDCGNDGDVTGGTGGFGATEQMTDGFSVEQNRGRLARPVEIDLEVAGDEDQLALILQVGFAADRFEADGAIHGAGIEEIESHPLGQRASD